jgi:phage major head subunit gpT-like protein
MGLPIWLEKGLRADFAVKMADFLAGRTINPGLMKAVMTIPSTSSYEKMGWIGAMPGVQEWIGELKAKGFEQYDYTIKNKDWAAAVPINQNDIDDDQIGVLSKIPALLVQRIMAHPEKLLVSLLNNGTTSLAYDGVAFFSDASGVRTFDNLLAGTGTSLAQIEADLNAALVQMAKFTDDQGESLNIAGDMIVCPKALGNKFRRLVNSQTDPTASVQGTYNPYAGKFTVIEDARLDAVDANDWYLLASSEIFQPLVLSMRKEPETNIEKVPGTKTYNMSADGRYNVGYGLPMLAVKTVNT